EDPVEYSIDGVNHIQINTKGDLTFANGLRSILRQDPNIIMVGEIRDQETARITVNSALTGHLVLSTLHANDAVSTIPRLIDMGIEPFLIASTLNIVVTQRLARRLCSHCRKEYIVGKSETHKELVKLRPDIQKHLDSSDKLYEAVGCQECHNTGYSGRIGIYEILTMSKELRDVIIEKPNLEVIEQNNIRAADLAIAKKMEERILNLQNKGDSVGAIIEIIIKDCPKGLGEPVFDKFKADLAKALMSINAIVGFEYGAGFAVANMKGSTHNQLETGILGGINFINWLKEPRKEDTILAWLRELSQWLRLCAGSFS
ncbi:MAG: general secretion pathway protein E (Type II traffic warden ATPase)(Cholera toxin secretion protein EpsE), general secretion pathway protein E, partial [Candidatus Peregrinibacteria bacterium GW2011_GWE2_39_6]